MKSQIKTQIIKEVRQILITEDKNTNIIVDKIKLPSVISDWITSEYPEKFQLWIANTFKAEAVKKISGNKEAIAHFMLLKLAGDKTPPSLINQLSRQKAYFGGAFREVMGWLQNRRELAPETDEINLKTLSYAEAIRRAEAWHLEVQRLKAAAIVDETGNIIKTYPNGFYWLDLLSSNCPAEARAMGHCGNGVGRLYSLRKYKNPVLTGDVHKGNLIQLRGRMNTKPKAEYHPYIIDFLLDTAIGIKSMNPSTYKPDSNFELKDLSLENINTLYSQKPTLFVPDELYKVLRKYPEFAHQVNIRVTPLHTEQKDDLLKRHPGMAELFN